MGTEGVDRQPAGHGLDDAPGQTRLDKLPVQREREIFPRATMLAAKGRVHCCGNDAACSNPLNDVRQEKGRIWWGTGTSERGDVHTGRSEPGPSGGGVALEPI
jgi:hypothetical protein